MADRFVLVPVRKWRDPWYRRLSSTERDVWDYLTQYPEDTYTGIFERDLSDMSHDAMLTKDDMSAAIKRFVSEGKLLVDGDCYLPVKYFHVQMRGETLNPIGRDGKKPDNRINPIVRELANFKAKTPSLVYKWKSIYAPWMLTDAEKRSPLQDPSETLRSPLQDPPKQKEVEIEEEYIYPPSTQASESTRARDPEAGDGGQPPTLSLPDVEATLPAACKDGWEKLKTRLKREHTDPRGITATSLAETLLTILTDKQRYQLSDEQLASGFEAANRNQRTVPLYVINAARGISQNKAKSKASEQYERRQV